MKRGPSFGLRGLCVLLLACGVGCSRKKTGAENPAPAAAAGSGGGQSAGSDAPPAAPVASGLPQDPRRISEIVNPKNEPAYSGKTGSVRGTVRATGDPAPVMEKWLKQIPENCKEARSIYGHLFNEGPGRSLADVLVAVTNYQGYVPEKSPTRVVEARGCAWDTRTIALTFGQAFEVRSRDQEIYIPDLLGAGSRVQLLATPKGPASKLYPPEPGRYLLIDSIKLFMEAEVLVLKYSTHDVTGIDGRYEISGVPVGKVKVGVFLPKTQAATEKEVEILADQSVELNFELPFDRKAYDVAVQSELEAAAAAGRGGRK